MRSAIHFFSGSLAVYMLMAACSASNGSKGSGSQASAGNASMQGGLGGMMSASGGDAVATGGAGGKGASATGGEGAVATSGMGGMLGNMMDPVPEADAETKSGTRLKARYYLGADGSKQFIGWRDTMRNEDCYIAKAEDGQLHCMPIAGAAAATYFGDKECTAQPLTVVAKASQACANVAAAAPTTMYLAEACGANRTLYTVGQTPVVAVFQKTGANCTALPQVLLDTYNFFPLMAPVAAPASAFVAATEQVE